MSEQPAASSPSRDRRAEIEKLQQLSQELFRDYQDIQKRLEKLASRIADRPSGIQKPEKAD